ncbi:choloylglycine hydrolase family protein [Pedobacter sp. PLR]|uniref:choloylglycine hydrolase family protein n=1 Tax=Pedobacter sp. PLR TaxID=2994465 RepID=UPI002245B39E|nr:choloylglycine hydrolase family protein [Pedobacter sp. PLR]MCX2452056.1 choloylglycine hydrolase family protein [Pedobacter sp. PLR]
MCTGIQVKTESGAPIYGRTMEFATDLRSEVLVIPKGIHFVGAGPQVNVPGLHWTSRYDITGLNVMELNLIIDGINSEGLSVGAFYFTNYADYMKVQPEEADQSLCSTDLPTYLLSTCKTVEEVKIALLEIKVNKGAHTGAPNQLAQDATAQVQAVALHYNIHDAEGNVLVVEYTHGELHMHDNPIGVLTNSPDYMWHYTNLSNYVNLTPINVTELPLKNMTDKRAKLPPVKAFGQGTGLLGLPGDYTPPSRFIRAVFYSQSVIPVKENEEAVLQAFHILDAFDIPLGTIRDSQGDPEYTQWTVASDLEKRKFYFHTVNDRTIRMVDLANWKFTDQIVTMSINQRPNIINMADHKKVADLVL